MSSVDWAVVVAVGFGGVSALLTSYVRFIQEREKMRQERYRFEIELRRMDETVHSASSSPQDKNARDLEVLIRNQSDLLRDLASRPITINLEANTASSPQGSQSEAKQLTRTIDLAGTESLVREISHSLNTPLSQVEVALSLLGDNQERMLPDDQASLQRAVSSVAVCKAFIQAFRYVVLADRDSADVLAGASLNDVLNSAVMPQAAKREVDLVTKLPDQIDQYRSAFLLAMLLPLVENAIESSSPGDQVRVSSEDKVDWTEISVQNHLEPSPPESMFEPRFSTKPNHDGMGLVVVMRLLNSIPGGRLTHDWQDSTMTFRIELPRGRK